MKNSLIVVFMLSIIGLYATVTINTGPTTLKISTNINENKSLVKVTDAYTDIIAGIANCYGVSPSDVTLSVNHLNYTIISLGYFGSVVYSDCGTNCTTCCIKVSPSLTPCCFNIPYDL